MVAFYAVELKLALLLLVFYGVEQRLIVGGPTDGANPLDEIGAGAAGFKIHPAFGSGGEKWRVKKNAIKGLLVVLHLANGREEILG